MILWTIQSITAWRVMEDTGILRCAPDFVDPDFVAAYKWMAQQMNERLDIPSVNNAFPLWAWYQYQNEKRAKPDLRVRGFFPRGQKGIRIEFEVDDAKVLLSDYELWHYVLNYWYLPRSTADEESFDATLSEKGLSFYKSKPLPDPFYDNRIKESWTRIFDIDWAENEIALPRSDKSIQATFWELSPNMVRSTTEFTAR